MKIQFKKEDAKASTLCCIRDNGSMTWTKMHKGIEAHDLGHYAVETVLGFEHAFYGMVAKGTNIEDFELPREERPKNVVPQNLHPEALIAEHLVNLLMVKALDPSGLDIMPMLQSILKENSITFPLHLNPEKMNMIWEEFQELHQQWINLKNRCYT